MTVKTNLFGKAGEVYPRILKNIVEEASGVAYPFKSDDEFKALLMNDMHRVYWEEILYRVHWAVVVNSVRHLRWFDACVVHSSTHPNYLAFSAALRGLLESSADVSFSLAAVPLTLASASGKIIKALDGSLDADFIVSAELEDALIHFHHARGVKKQEEVPPTHKAKTATNYINAIEMDEYPVRDLYSELCQLVHPAKQSLHWSSRLNKEGWSTEGFNDIESIHDLIGRYEESISWIQQSSGNTVVFLAQVLNMLPLEQLHIYSVKHLDMSGILLHDKIKKEFLKFNLHW